MSDDYTLLTPENVDLRFDVAGLGSRGAAALIDYAILGVGYAVLSFGGVFVASLVAAATSPDLSNGLTARIADIVGFVSIALFIVLTFFGWWGYFILTEMLWNGQSIGKRRLGIRVVRAGGQPISLTASLIRNILRVVDLFLFVGLLVMIVDNRSRRLGDFAAGTLVVREPTRGSAKDFAMALRPIEIPPVSAETVDSFPNPERLTMAHYALLRDYFARRPGMSTRSAEALALDLSARLATSLDADRSSIGNPVVFLATAARAFEARQRNRDVT